jgi:ABC-type Fe3+ transport system substrate-binding protein
MQSKNYINRHSFFSQTVGPLVFGLLAAIAWQPLFAQPKPAWQEKWDKAVAGAQKEGKVVVYGPPGEQIRNALIEGFGKAFPGISLEYSGGRSGAQAVQMKAERDGGLYTVDVFVGGPTTANFQLKPMGALDPIKPALILPQVADVKNWRGNRLEFSDKEDMYDLVFVSQASPPLIYNTKQAKEEELDEVHELLDPKWKGKIVINDPLVSGSAVPIFRHLWVSLGAEKARDFYRKLREQAGAVDRDQRRQIEWVAQGKYSVLLAPSHGVLAQLIERGVKVGVLETWKDIGTYVGSSFGTVMLINKAPHPNAATVFINWLLTRDGQLAWSKAMDHVSRRLDVPTDHIPSYSVPKPGVKYWRGFSEEAQTRVPEEEKLLKELFQR